MLYFSSTGSNAALRTLAHEEFFIIVTTMFKSKLQGWSATKYAADTTACRQPLLLVYLLGAWRFQALDREAAL